MKEKNINLNLKGAEEVWIREGNAPMIPDPVKHLFNGNLSGPADFYGKRKEFASNFSVVIFDSIKRQIHYIENTHDPLSIEVTGFAKFSNRMEHIVAVLDRKQAPDQLTKELKKFKSCATDLTELMRVISGLDNINLKIRQEVEQSNDAAGSVKDVFVQKIEHTLLLKFSLKFPIFAGAPTVEIPFEVELNVVGKNIEATLVSYDLIDLQEEIIENTFKREEKRFGENVVIIHA